MSFGPPLNAFACDYAEMRSKLAPNDCLVLYTDGVTEARRDGELFGDERLLEATCGLRGRPAQEVAESLRDAALAFAGKLKDDLQIVVVRLV